MEREYQRKPYNRLTEVMAEVAVELVQARALVKVLERQYQMLEGEYAKTQNYDPMPQRPPYEELGQ